MPSGLTIGAIIHSGYIFYVSGLFTEEGVWLSSGLLLYNFRKFEQKFETFQGCNRLQVL